MATDTYTIKRDVTVFLRILSDTRHFDLVPFGMVNIERRSFPAWHMKLIGPNATARIVPNLDRFEFSFEELEAVHLAAKSVARTRGPH